MKKMTLPLLLAGALLPSMPTYALGLGDIRLKSALNQVFDAEIDLVSATTDELATLRVTLADNETFKRYGLDRAAVLSNFSLRVDSVSAARPIIKLSSSNAINEPFLNLLVEVSWSGGRVLREYTLFLDPPVLGAVKGEATVVHSPSASTVTAAPSIPSQKSDATGALVRSTSVPVRAAASNAAPQTYTVKSADSLFKIASGLKYTTKVSVKQTMLAIYRANPNAFGGSMDVLRAGSVLRIPAANDVESVSSTEAVVEVKSQPTSERTKEAVAATTKPNNERLKLVPAKELSGGGGDQTNKSSQVAVTSTVATASVNDRIKVLEAELAEAKRLIDVKSAELAQIQQQISTAPQTAGTSKSSLSTESVSSAASSEASVSSVASESSAQAQQSVASAKPDHQTAVESWLAVAAKNSVAIILSALGLIVVLLLWVRWRQRRAASEDFAAFSNEKDFPEYSQDHSDDQSGTSKEIDQVADRSNQFTQTLPPGSSLEDTTTTRPILSDITLSGETALDVKQHDVLAEAEFHLAYGLYDQAAEIIKRAIERQPERRELKLKLAEIYFTWGNKEAFLDFAHKLRNESAYAGEGEWDKVVEMGRQLCPHDPLFDGGVSASAPTNSANSAGDDRGIDIDLYDASESYESPSTIAQPAGNSAGQMKNHAADLDFIIDEPERAADEDTSTTRRTGTFNFSTPATNQSNKGEDLFPSHDEPTIQTAKLSLDDMDFDIENFEKGMSPLASSTASDDTVQDTRAHASIGVHEDRVIDDRTIDVTRPHAVLDRALSADDAEAALMNEVGTKLDLARAYMDMGDPDGARSILQEVLQEGSAGQKLEAERLLSSIG